MNEKLKQQLEELQPGKPVVIKERKSTIDRVVESISGNYVIQRLRAKQCVVTLVEGFQTAREELHEMLDFSNPFDVINYDSASVDYIRVLVNEYNVKNNRAFKVSIKDNVITITEPFGSIKQIPSLQADAWRSAFEKELVKKLV